MALVLSPNFIGIGNRIEETGMLLIAATILALAVYRARQIFFAQIAAESDRQFLTKTFGEFVPHQLADKLLDDPSALAPQSRSATVISVDIAGFTAFTERAGPEATITMLNDFFTESAEIISANDGVIVDFSGDGFLAAFDVPLPVDQPEQRAVDASRALLALVEERPFDGERITIWIGIASGDVAADSVGGGGRRAYTVHGDTASQFDPSSIATVEEATMIRGRRNAVSIHTLADRLPASAD